MTTRILVADDEPAILEALAYALERDGFDVTGVGDGDAALSEGRGGGYDLVILDVMMPGQSGMDVCRALRSESDVPIVMLTAKDAEVDRVLGLVEVACASRTLDPDTITWVDQMVEERRAARSVRDFARADAIRRELEERCIVLEDSANGTRWKVVGRVEGTGSHG